MTFSVFELFALLALPGFIFWVWSLTDALKRPDNDWEQADQDKLVWTLVLIFLSFVGSFIYLAVARPRLEEAKRGF